MYQYRTGAHDDYAYVVTLVKGNRAVKVVESTKLRILLIGTEPCTYHIVWTPKYRFRILESLVKELLTNDIQMLTEWKS